MQSKDETYDALVPRSAIMLVSVDEDEDVGGMYGLDGIKDN